MKTKLSGLVALVAALAMAGCASHPPPENDGKTMAKPRQIAFRALSARPLGGINYHHSEQLGANFQNGEIQLILAPGSQSYGATWCACTTVSTCSPVLALGAIKGNVSTTATWKFKISPNVQVADPGTFQVGRRERRVYALAFH